MKELSVLICCYGDFPQYSNRCIDSVVSEPRSLEVIDVHVGCNACGGATLSHMRKLRDKGQISSLIETDNINKDPMMRQLIGLTKTQYLIWMDDDSHFKPGWLEATLNYVASEAPFDCSGHTYFINRDRPEYEKLVSARPWWGGLEKRTESQRKQIFFSTGGLFIARTAFLRENNFPDRNMLKLYDDILLGDLIQEKNGNLKVFKPLLPYVKISDGKRRGTGESTDAFIYSEDARTEL